MNPEDVPIPDRLKKFLPLWKDKYLVHYTVFVGPDKVPDFKVVHEERRMKAIREQLCHLCGEKLVQPFVFIGGPKCGEHHAFIDGPMHEECAKYAVLVCPYLNNPKHGHSNAEAKHKGDETLSITTMEQVAVGRPPKMGLFYTNSYRVGRQGNQIFILAGQWLKTDWDTIPSG